MNTKNKKLVNERINKLFQLAKDTVREDEKLAQRYVTLARRLSMASRVRIPCKFRQQVCRVCKKFILPGVSCRVRIRQHREPHLVVTCGYCGHHMRFPLKPKKKEEK